MIVTSSRFVSSVKFVRDGGNCAHWYICADHSIKMTTDSSYQIEAYNCMMTREMAPSDPIEVQKFDTVRA